ncbi:efflux RND transporter periplasmic adaptor subunit [Photobacterium indicum]|uniref:Efflux RND transporter periplasmic adaptor subunit n=1 Tax=Photobacterium indicum TaxID=81447 RepID=A0A2T3L9H2_9GAMM|nr:efflux RND transporter periplasmic adaptor subunit [Photobacterium indicum]PSV47646.1 efflux RND transporter periplasmic adaptor subunit [Photobacterium indicum]
MPQISSRYTLHVLILAALLGGCNSSSSEPEIQTEQLHIASVNAMTLTPSDHYMVTREYVGIVQAGQQSNLGFELGGKIAQIFVDVGDKIQEGDPLIVLDTQLLKTSADQLTAQQAQITAQLELVNANLKRQNTLKKKGFSAESEIDNLNSQRNALRANYRQVGATLAANRLQQEKSTIYAPYSGTISARYISKGDVVNTGSPTLRLLASNRKEAHVGIPTMQLLRVNQLSQSSATNTENAANTDGKKQWVLRIGDKTYTTTLLNPGASVNLNSRSITLRFELPDSVTAIDGELAYLQLDDKHDDNGYWVPLSAMTDGLRGVWNVYVLSEESADENNTLESSKKKLRVERRSVQVLYANGKQAYISGAVNTGEKLVSDGLHRLVPGQTVVISERSWLPKKLSLPLIDSEA